jgi:hypothetical protein
MPEHYSFNFFKQPITASRENFIMSPPKGQVLRITHAHGNIETASDGTTERVFFAYLYHPNTYGAHFGDGQMLFLLDAILPAHSQTNSCTGGPSVLGTGFLSSPNTKKGNMAHLNGTHLPWAGTYVEVTEDMALAYHEVGAPDDTFDLQVDGYFAPPDAT